MKTQNNHRTSLINLIKQVSYRHSTWTVFQDFLELSAIAMSNAIDYRERDEREKRYLDVVAKYDKREVDLIVKMFAELSMALEDEPADVLGSIYHELELSNKWNGQFFTPMSIANMMGLMVIDGIKEQIARNGYATVSEPTCGGGAIIIGLANAMMKEGINYQKHLFVTAVDIDLKSVYMTYLQTGLLGIPAVVIHGDSLAVKEYTRLYTPMYVMNGWHKYMVNEKVKIDVNGIGKNNEPIIKPIDRAS